MIVPSKRKQVKETRHPKRIPNTKIAIERRVREIYHKMGPAKNHPAFIRKLKANSLEAVPSVNDINVKTNDWQKFFFMQWAGK